MEHYFFDLNEHGDRTTDEEGRDLTDLRAAHEQAVCEARELMSDEIRRGILSLEFVIEVRDEAGAIVLSVPFSEAVEVGNSHFPWNVSD